MISSQVFISIYVSQYRWILLIHYPLSFSVNIFSLLSMTFQIHLTSSIRIYFTIIVSFRIHSKKIKIKPSGLLWKLSLCLKKFIPFSFLLIRCILVVIFRFHPDYSLSEAILVYLRDHRCGRFVLHFLLSCSLFLLPRGTFKSLEPTILFFFFYLKYSK